MTSEGLFGPASLRAVSEAVSAIAGELATEPVLEPGRVRSLPGGGRADLLAPTAMSSATSTSSCRDGAGGHSGVSE